MSDIVDDSNNSIVPVMNREAMDMDSKDDQDIISINNNNNGQNIHEEKHDVVNDENGGNGMEVESTSELGQQYKIVCCYHEGNITCDNYEVSYFNDAQRERLRYICGEHRTKLYNEGKDTNIRRKATLLFKCGDALCCENDDSENNLKDIENNLKSLLNFIKHQHRMNVQGRGHENAELYYEKYGIGPCLNWINCKQFIKKRQLNYPLNSHLQVGQNGMCRDCKIKVDMEDISMVEDILDIFLDIDKAILWQPLVEDQLPNEIITEIAGLESWIMRNKRISLKNGDNIKHQRFVILKEIFQKFVTAQWNRGGKSNTHFKIKKMKGRITAVRNNDTFKLIKYMKEIIKNEEKQLLNSDKAVERYNNMSEKQKKRKDEMMALKRANKNAAKCAWSKAYISVKDVKFVNLDEEKNGQLYRDKFIGHDMSYTDACISFISGDYPQLKIEQRIMNEVISGSNSGSVGGTDLINAFTRKQKWEFGSEEYRREYCKQAEDICNNNLSQFQRENSGSARGAGILKDDGSIRPLVMQNIDQRDADKCRDVICMKDKINMKYKNQRFMDKNALTISVKSIDAMDDFCRLYNQSYLKQKIENIIESEEIQDDSDDNNVIDVTMETMTNRIWENEESIKEFQNCMKVDGVNINITKKSAAIILKSMYIENNELDNLLFKGQNDKENCYNRMKREPGLESVAELYPQAYLGAYAAYSCPTKVVIGRQKRQIMLMKDGGIQGKSVTTDILLCNEVRINARVEIALQLIKNKYDFDVNKNINYEQTYIDDNNSIGTLRGLAIKKEIAAMVQVPFGDKFKKKKSKIAMEFGED
eukprot:385888_1